MVNRNEIISRVGDIYSWIDGELCNQKAKAGGCGTCGKCCDFESFGHRLFVTTPEILYFRGKIGEENPGAPGQITKQLSQHCHPDPIRCAQDKLREGSGLKKKEILRCAQNDKFRFEIGFNGRCCYQVDQKCSVYDYRFASCRIFCCKGDAGFQSDLTESVIKKFKTICDEFKIPYRYVDLPMALQNYLPPSTLRTQRIF